MATLDRELATFRRELPGLLANLANVGRYVLVHGDNVLGLFSSFDDALAAGYERVGIEPFLVKEITEHEQPRYFSRSLRCPSSTVK